ncbi:hypothetical protein BGZ89_011110 [Linnemannia elongata]|nr:hypothetical protein BGZ89_011110 [Linnemannia elongata]
MGPVVTCGTRSADESSYLDNMITGILGCDQQPVKYSNPCLLGYLFPNLYPKGRGFFSKDYRGEAHLPNPPLGLRPEVPVNPREIANKTPARYKVSIGTEKAMGKVILTEMPTRSSPDGFQQPNRQVFVYVKGDITPKPPNLVVNTLSLTTNETQPGSTGRSREIQTSVPPLFPPKTPAAVASSLLHL